MWAAQNIQLLKRMSSPLVWLWRIRTRKISQRTKPRTYSDSIQGRCNELPYALTKELNSVTKQIFHHSCPVGFDGCYSSVSSMNFQCFFPKESFKCICAIYSTILYWGRGGKTSFPFNIVNTMSRVRRNCYKGDSSKVASVSKSISKWCAVLSVKSWCGSLCCGLKCGKRDLNFQGGDKQWTVAKTDSCPLDSHSTLL